MVGGFDVTGMAANNALRDGESEAMTPFGARPRRIHPVERLEKMRQGFVWHSGAFIAHFDHDGITARGSA
tara:strand:- start:63 stop:272 length:210 start_codon:yes stop_codon:yes gene_type:complete